MKRHLMYKITVVFTDGSVCVYRQDKPLLNHGDHYLFDPQDGYYGVSIPFHNVRTVLTTVVDDEQAIKDVEATSNTMASSDARMISI